VRSRGGEYIGASLMLQVVYMEFIMINSVLGLLVWDSK
jgi:hypothetical protein